jgi:hypothetical protein
MFELQRSRRVEKMIMNVEYVRTKVVAYLKWLSKIKEKIPERPMSQRIKLCASGIQSRRPTYARMFGRSVKNVANATCDMVHKTTQPALLVTASIGRSYSSGSWCGNLKLVRSTNTDTEGRYFDFISSQLLSISKKVKFSLCLAN